MNNDSVPSKGMRTCGHIYSDDLVEFAKKALESIYEIESYPELKAMAHQILNDSKEGKKISHFYSDFVDLIDDAGETENMEICPDCGHIPETGACFTCKMD